jgi:copper chaperone CopZ
MTKQRFQIQGMHCVGCAMSVDGALEELEGVKSATTSYARQVVDVEYDEQMVSEEQILEAVEAAGYQANRTKNLASFAIRLRKMVDNIR